MTQKSILQLKREENAACDAYYAIKGKISADEAKPLHDAMVKATKARQAAMTSQAGQHVRLGSVFFKG